MERLNLNITGMSCGHCVSAVTEALTELGGVEVERVVIGSATVAYDPGTTTPDQITQAVEDAGYQAQPAGSAA
jgi:copper chaperone CopZ